MTRQLYTPRQLVEKGWKLVDIVKKGDETLNAVRPLLAQDRDVMVNPPMRLWDYTLGRIFGQVEVYVRDKVVE